MDQKGKQMENYSSSSSSFTMDLFGPKDSSKTSSSSSTTLFGSIFDPPVPVVPGRDHTPRSDTGNAKHGTLDHIAQKSNRVMKKDMNSTYDQKGTIEPCYYNSSIYYGGQEVYFPTTSKRNVSPNHFKKDGEDVDPNESSASRGNWWQGSLYY